MPKCTTARAVVFAVLSTLALPALAESCGAEQYFAPTDASNAEPLEAPHAEFRKTQALARGGNAAEARNLASLYEAGYLVSACHEKAAYWYDKAASGGDDIAKAWMERNARMARLRSGPECLGNACFAAAGNGGNQTAVLRLAGRRYDASVTVNGKSVRGIIDTGATSVAMSATTAKELGVSYSGGRQVRISTANGSKMGHAVMLSSITVENITLDNVRAVVSEGDHPLLIGMSFLSRVTMSTSNGGMTLVKR